MDWLVVPVCDGRDYVAFGELFRNDGMAPDSSRLLPEGWVDASVEDHGTCPDSGQGYGYQWWLARDDHGSFAANGYEGQRLQVSQKLGLTFVRLGKTTAEHSEELRAFYAQVATASPADQINQHNCTGANKIGERIASSNLGYMAILADIA